MGYKFNLPTTTWVGKADSVCHNFSSNVPKYGSLSHSVTANASASLRDNYKKKGC